VDLTEVAANVFMFIDSCNVFLLRDGSRGILVDFGSGSILDALADCDVAEVTDVLMTHHHRDQAQGLARAIDMGIRVWVPPVERDLFDAVDRHWLSRRIDNDYDLMQDRFSLLEPVPVTGVTAEYKTRSYGAWDVLTLPTPGHTVGSVSHIVSAGGQRIAFVGDLVYGVGKVWSLASMQWSYSGLEGAGMTIASLNTLRETAPDLLLTSHGAPIADPLAAIETVTARLDDLLQHRPTTKAFHIEARDMARRTEHPFDRVTDHLVMNRTSRSISYALLSKDRVALMFDFGYDMTTSLPTPTDRYARRPWLASLPALHRDYGIDMVEVVMPTHYHDDHVAGFNLLRENEGTQVWAGANIAPVISDPKRYDLPCLWFDPITVDKVLPLGVSIQWHEYDLTLYELPGHTLYAVATVFSVDGQRIIVTGDQQDGAWLPGEQPEYLNYQYRNGFEVDDYVRSAHLYREISPDLIISGHWAPRVVSDAYLEALREEGEHVARLHRELLPLEAFNLGAGGFGARIQPYRSTVERSGAAEVEVIITNPLASMAQISGNLVMPSGWKCDPTNRRFSVEGHGSKVITFVVYPSPSVAVRRARIAIDLTLNGQRWGQQAEALIDVL
jgi:glyoxylase-like metal-dependent hydrolase (beta-lactamase superfamily II)